MIYHRKSRGVKPAEFHSHPWLEIGWSIAPLIILILMAIPATKVLLRMNNTDKEALTIKITGYQWKWHYEYLEDGVSFFSNLATPYGEIHSGAVPTSASYLRDVDHTLVVPIHKKIRFLITSNDVNHAWWVPDLAVKRDAIAGFINEAWTIIDKPGTYYGQCAELCGVNHAFMPIVVVATTEEGYKNWVAQQKGTATQATVDINKEWTLQELMAKGEKVYSSICAACHQPTGLGIPPSFPALKGSKIATGPLADHINIVTHGKTGTAMQAFLNQLSDEDLAAVITYERNAFGNNTGTLVQPIQIKALRDGKSMSDALATKPSAAPVPAAVPTPIKPTPTPTTGRPVAAPTTQPAQAPAPTVQPVPTAQPAPAAPAPAQPVAVVPAPPVQPGTATVPPTQPAAPTQAAQPTAPLSKEDELKQVMARGEKVYMNTCAVCHQPMGTGMPPTFPALKGGKITTGPVQDHIHMVMFGKTGTAMQAFKDQFSDQDLADVITYERNAWGNNTGSIVRPEDIKAARQTPPAPATPAAQPTATTQPAASQPVQTN